MALNFLEIDRRVFTFEDQKKFSNISGDKNPIHLDSNFAKKTIAGECIVHGIHAFLWALESISSKINITLSHAVINFKNPIHIDETVILNLDSKLQEIQLLSIKGVLFISIKYKLSDSLSPMVSTPISSDINLFEPLDSDVFGLEKGVEIPSIYGGNQRMAAKIFSNLCTKLGEDRVYEISLLSNIVGMQVPGLHSLFVACDIFFEVGSLDRNPSYKIMESYINLGLLKLQYTGKNINSNITALRRPSYTPKSCDELLKTIPTTHLLKDKKILVIGGSRGIGAVFSKVAALNGAKVSVTYASNELDAQEICSDIENHTSAKVKYFHLDVTENNLIDNFPLDYDVLCYFASSKIFGKTTTEFEISRYKNFFKIYCEGFERIAKRFLAAGGCCIYYPSSVAVDKDNKGLEEYKVAKSIGELVCRSLINNKGANIIIDRLDRVATDQTLSILRVPAVDASQVALDITNKIIKSL